MPKRSVDSKFKRSRHKAAKVVAEDLRENLIHLRGRRLGANSRAELGLNHMERGFHVRPLMVVLKELFAIIGEEVESASPQSPARGRVAARPVLSVVRSSPVPLIGFEGNQREGSSGVDGFEIGVSDIGSISGDRLDGEPLSGRLEERG